MPNQSSWNWEPQERRIAELAPLRERFFEVHEYAVSPDGERIAVPVVPEPGGARVWENGALWDDELERAWSLRYTPDGRLAALVRVDDMWSVAVDGKRWEGAFDFAWNLKTSPAGR